jgi:sugar phosphate isomerase/epimerase
MPELALGVMTVFHTSPYETLTRVASLGVPTIQISYPAHLDTDEGVQQIKDGLAATRLEVTTVFVGFEEEDYTDIPAVRATVGLVPPQTRSKRVKIISDISDFAKKLGVRRVAAHIGFIPEDANDERYPALVTTVRGVCEMLASRDQDFALETGQETARTLHRFIGDVGARNLRVNFDPANMILYGNDQPIPAVRLLAPWIDGVHCKDGCWPTESFKLGREMPLGQGDVNIPQWIETLLEIGYRGPLTIEREIPGEQQMVDIRAAKKLIEDILQKNRSTYSVNNTKN